MTELSNIVRTVESGRRRVVKGLIGLGGLGFLGGSLTLIKSVIPDVKSFSDVEYNDVEIVHQEGDKSGEPVTVDDLPGSGLGGALGGIGAADGEPVWIAHVDSMSSETQEYFSETADQGVVTYSATCVHLGCIYQLKPEEGCESLGFCECHLSTYNFCDMGKPTGGPAQRAVPALDIKVDGDGKIVATGTFNAPIGPDERAPKEV